MITLQDIADRVGVTRTVVSYVLNNRLGKIRVSEAKRLRILELAKELQYVPNHSARALTTKENRTLGMVINYPRSTPLTAGGSVYVFNLLAGMHAACDPIEYRCVYALSDMRSAAAFEMPPFLKERSIDAALLVGYVHREVEEQLLKLNIPLLHIGDNVDPTSRLNCISADLGETLLDDVLDSAVLGGLRSVHLLLAKGPGSQKITKAFTKHGATRHPGVKVTAKMSNGSYITFDDAWQHGLELGQNRPPQLIIAGVDDIPPLVGALRSCGWDCPRDFQILAFSSEGYQELRFVDTSIPLSQIVVPLVEIGSQAARYLIQKTNDVEQATFERSVRCRFLPGGTAPALQQGPLLSRVASQFHNTDSQKTIDCKTST